MGERWRLLIGKEVERARGLEPPTFSLGSYYNVVLTFSKTKTWDFGRCLSH